LQNPAAISRLRIFQKVLVEQTIFAGHGRKRFANLDSRLQQQARGFFAVVVKVGFGFKLAGQPRLDSVGITVDCNLWRITVGTVSPWCPLSRRVIVTFPSGILQWTAPVFTPKTNNLQ
jgi:predicted metalloendopeptidase